MNSAPLEHSFTVAAFQTGFPTSDLDANLESVRERLEWANARDVTLVCFPECSLTGYFTRLEEASQVAITLESAVFTNALKRLETFDSTIVLGLIERDLEALYNTAVVISRGRLLGKYRKTHPNEKCFLPGNDYPIFDADGVQFGVNICFDANFPEAAARVARAGARVIVYPLNNALPENVATRWRTKSPENLISRAKETGCYIVSADVTGRNGLNLSYGCTRIISPDGRTLSAAPEFEPGAAIATIRLTEGQKQ